MDAFRYAQFCPLARATEVLGQRWSLLVIRELSLGPLRFTDLRRRLCGVSPSVLSERLASLESLGVIARCELPAPAASVAYALTPSGEALKPILRDLTRWGMRFLGAPRPGDHVEPAWLLMAVDAFARRTPTPALALSLRVTGDGPPAEMRVVGGEAGTSRAGPGAVDARIEAPALVVQGLMAGLLGLEAAEAAGARVEGDREAARALPALFDVPFDPAPANDSKLPTPEPAGTPALRPTLED